ncbi:LysR family transcriptional regulator [Sorangium cellulosum]|uniref:LysR family transcriptional regulator n=1 Tax=Sorangium cellulosum TaxID=56 RepID=A0A150SB98_SORCE|nr:LysR family transcriptional regulator [Sorangium cellulosum]KYF89719.1 LysR family transcriptional regulator [Sorangium cellulosum]
MELRHLRYFIAIAEEESFRRAAEKLRVSQSPLSRQMQQLEEEIGAELFEPSGRGVKLTTAGRLLLDRAKTILSDVDAAAKEVRETAEGQIGTVTIGFESGSAYIGPLSMILSRFRELAPRVNVELVPMSSAQQWDALREGQISLGYGNYVPDDSSLESVVLARHRLGIVVPKQHPLATASTINVKDLATEPVLMDPRKSNPRLYDDIIAAVRARGVTLNVASEILDGEALLTLVASGFGLTFGAEPAARFLAVGTAIWRPVSDLGLEMLNIAMWRPDAPSLLLKPLIGLVRELGVAPRDRETGLRRHERERQRRPRRG